VKSPEDLFQPFKSGVDSAGLGLFVSRAIVRACGGDLTYEPAPEGCTMLIRLQQERDSAEAPIDNEQEVNSSQVHP
jgi:signal transduction histidine kinase